MHQFDFSGGALCCDLVNTWGDRSDPANERLGGYVELLEWAKQAEVLGEGVGSELADLARQKPGAADGVFGVAIELREAIYRAFSAAAAGKKPVEADIGFLNGVLAAIPRQRLCCGGECCEWEWSPEELDLDRVLWPVVRSAADLLTSSEVGRIRECDAPDCNWLFLDHSRGGRRKWCDMSTCGNRAKARRYYERHRKAESA